MESIEKYIERFKEISPIKLIMILNDPSSHNENAIAAAKICLKEMKISELEYDELNNKALMISQKLNNDLHRFGKITRFDRLLIMLPLYGIKYSFKLQNEANDDQMVNIISYYRTRGAIGTFIIIVALGILYQLSNYYNINFEEISVAIGVAFYVIYLKQTFDNELVKFPMN